MYKESPEYPVYSVGLGQKSSVHHGEPETHSEPLQGAARHPGLGQEEEGVEETEEDPGEENIAQLPTWSYRHQVLIKHQESLISTFWSFISNSLPKKTKFYAWFVDSDCSLRYLVLNKNNQTYYLYQLFFFSLCIQESKFLNIIL